ncbi:unnamed protein product, partial [Phaeothamnion confervicola]
VSAPASAATAAALRRAASSLRSSAGKRAAGSAATAATAAVAATASSERARRKCERWDTKDLCLVGCRAKMWENTGGVCVAERVETQGMGFVQWYVYVVLGAC